MLAKAADFGKKSRHLGKKSADFFKTGALLFALSAGGMILSARFFYMRRGFPAFQVMENRNKPVIEGAGSGTDAKFYQAGLTNYVVKYEKIC